MSGLARVRGFFGDALFQKQRLCALGILAENLLNALLSRCEVSLVTSSSAWARTLLASLRFISELLSRSSSMRVWFRISRVRR